MQLNLWWHFYKNNSNSVGSEVILTPWSKFNSAVPLLYNFRKTDCVCVWLSLVCVCVWAATVSSPADFDPVRWNSGQQRVLHLNQKLRAEEEDEEEDFDK